MKFLHTRVRRHAFCQPTWREVACDDPLRCASDASADGVRLGDSVVAIADMTAKKLVSNLLALHMLQLCCDS